MVVCDIGVITLTAHFAGRGIAAAGSDDWQCHGTGAWRSAPIIAAGYPRATCRTNPDGLVVRHLQLAHNEQYPEIEEVRRAGPLFVLVALASPGPVAVLVHEAAVGGATTTTT
jgi:hypothetical protein